ncbi:hypothetical protein PVK06_047506 [Gossypium arboreum]|uniref:SWIM-type domain-containing protein n=1 Tax=Gossypium arboreum TaxID=29729 RepID=A0ABR0MDH1_GOSAR|nr:hypothetical protein PVK06_047506 [Gossypium arboreum]
MIACIILLMVKVDLRIVVSVLIANIRSQFNYTPSYRKVWIAKQMALEKMHSGWDASYNEYRVHLRNRIYDCEKFDALHFLCTHAIAAHIDLRLDLMSFVDEVYKLENYTTCGDSYSHQS